ncbi:uncharacterized protein LOC143557312 [Bidens hawaiensis]|uniref:uncharacterized protein LOC143557312 n=1 Tax=Bidens hawaiensis TaxID=980011 RepID=UPI004049EA26
MESFGTILDQKWESLSRMFSGDQEHFSGHGLFSSEQDHGLNFETPFVVSSVMTESNIANPFCNSYENVNPNFYHDFSQETSNNECFSYPSSNLISLPSNGACDHEPVDFYGEMINNNSSLLAQVFSDDTMEGIQCLRQNINIENSVDPQPVPIADKLKHTPSKRKIEMPEAPNKVEDKVNDENPDEKLKKKTRVSRESVSITILL